MKYVKAKAAIILRTFLIVLYVAYYIGTTAFIHTHYFPTYSVTHSHPFRSAPDGSPMHTHSQVAFDTIAHLNHVFTDAASYFVLAAVFTLLLTVILSYRPPFRISPVRFRRLRAPPLF